MILLRACLLANFYQWYWYFYLLNQLNLPAAIFFRRWALACLSTPSSPSNISINASSTLSGSLRSRELNMALFLSEFVLPASTASFSPYVRRSFDKRSCTMLESSFFTNVAWRRRRATLAGCAMFLDQCQKESKTSSCLVSYAQFCSNSIIIRERLRNSQDHTQNSTMWRDDMTERGSKRLTYSDTSLPSMSLPSTPTRSMATSDGHRQDRHLHCDSPAREKTSFSHSSISSSVSSRGEKVTLLVDGKRFSVNPTLFTKQPNTMLGRWIFKVTDCNCCSISSLGCLTLL